MAEWVGNAGLLALPGALVVFLAFNAGGFFPETVAVVALILVLVLAGRIIAAESPFAGFSVPVGIAAGALGLYALWTLLSADWSGSTWRAFTEFDRALVYLLALVLYGSLPRRPDHTRWAVRGLSLGIVIVCLSGLISRVEPDVWHTEAGFVTDRLSFPITYWNAVGLLAAIGVILCFHLTSSRAEPRPIRAASAGAVPILATTLYFTLSRGAILVCAIGLIVYVLAGRPRSFLSALIACLPTAAIAVVVAYNADDLVGANSTSAAAMHQGDRVAAVVAICAGAAILARLGLILLARRLPRPSLSIAAKRAAAGFAVGVVIAAAIGAAIVLDLPHFVSKEYNAFVSTGPPAGGSAQAGDIRNRLTSASGSGRVNLWNVAVDDGFDPNKLTGYGAGTFELVWAQHRPRKFPIPVVNAHSLYVQVLGELGIVGLLLIVVVVGTILYGFAARLRGPNRTVYAALGAAALAWAIRAGIDWDWEMPVVTLWVFALGGIALAARAEHRRRSRRPAPLARGVAATVCLAVGVLPLLILLSQLRLDDATSAYLGRNDCRTAVSAAQSSTSAISAQPEPYAIEGYCDASRGSPRRGIREMAMAVGRDPDNWKWRYGLAVATARAGKDPRAAMRKAMRLNPREPLVKELAIRLDTSARSQWRDEGRILARRPVL